MLDELMQRAQGSPRELWGVHVGDPFVDGRIFLDWGYLFANIGRHSVTLSVDWTPHLPASAASPLKRRLQETATRRAVARVGSEWTWTVFERPHEPEIRRWFREQAAELLALVEDPDAVEDEAWASATVSPTGRSEWRYEREASWSLRGEVTAREEDRFVSKLIELGADVRPNRMDAPVPDHRHRAGRQFTDGEAFCIDGEWGELSYVPHESVSTTFTTGTRWSIRLDPSEWRRARDGFRLMTYDVSELRSLPSGRIIPVDEVRGNARLRAPNPSELAKAGYTSVEDRWAYRGDVQLEKALERLGEWMPEAPLEATWTTSKDGDRGFRRAASWQLNRAASRAGWPKAARGLLAACEPESESTRLLVREHVPHEGPPSERGVLRIRHADPAAAIAWLDEHGLVERVEAVHEPGRPLPALDVYAHGELPLPQLPKNNMIVHGLTGAKSGEESLERLEMIVVSGGLKSLAERRRLGLTLSSLDQHGDTASSMDLGVPATVTAMPWAGAGVFFVMHPRILGRRDMWMMNGCPGGTGAEQRAAYATYAKSLGHRLGSPPPHEARTKHLRSGLTQYNEIYFKYEIPCRDIVALLVTTEDSLHLRVAERMEEWRAAGLIDAVVIPYADQGNAGNFGVLPGPNQSVGLSSAIAGLWKQYHPETERPRHRDGDRVGRRRPVNTMRVT